MKEADVPLRSPKALQIRWAWARLQTSTKLGEPCAILGAIGELMAMRASVLRCPGRTQGCSHTHRGSTVVLLICGPETLPWDRRPCRQHQRPLEACLQW